MSTSLRGLITAAVLAVGLLAPAAGQAKNPCGKTGPVNPAVSQYVEQIPTSCGPKSATSKGGSASAAATLAPAVQQALQAQGGSDTTLLQEVATKPEFGAPAVTKKVSKAKRERIVRVQRERPKPVTAALGTLSGGSGGAGGRLLGLLAIMGASLAVALAALIARARRR